jgi:predicted nucleotidyltransferase
MKKLNINEEVKPEVEEVVAVLKENGCKKIYLFGSIVKGKFKKTSDIDVAISGLEPRKFIMVYSKIMMKVDRKVDLIDLDDTDDYFVKNILKKEELVEVE